VPRARQAGALPGSPPVYGRSAWVISLWSFNLAGSERGGSMWPFFKDEGFNFPHLMPGSKLAAQGSPATRHSGLRGSGR
jgi:hypothetical protein